MACRAAPDYLRGMSYLDTLKAKRAELAGHLALLEGPNVTFGLREGDHEVRVFDLRNQIAIQDVAIKAEEARLYAQGS
jgi:hypothetical protein